MNKNYLDTRFGADYHVSAGGVVYRQAEDGFEVLLLKRTEAQDKEFENSYHLPKGSLEDDETILQAATRETEEESGILGEAEVYLGATLRQNIPHGKYMAKEKTTHYFLFNVKKDHGKILEPEYDERQWVKADEAIKLLSLSKKQEEIIVERALEYLNAGS